MKVLVTGAGGFIGSALCHELLARGLTVQAVLAPGGSRHRLAAIESQLTLVEWDLIASASAFPESIDAPDACIHCGWFVHPSRYLTALENLTWTHKTLELFQTLASVGCRRIVGVGTCFEYQASSVALTEQSPLAPSTLYAAAKASTYLSARALLAQLGVSFAWARIFYLFGPGEHPARLVSSAVLALIEGRRVDLTHGRQIRDFLHVADVASALGALATRDIEGSINVGSGYPATVREVVEHLGRITGRSDLLNFGARSGSVGDPPCVLADASRLREATGWVPRFDLASGLEQTVAWWRENGCKSPA